MSEFCLLNASFEKQEVWKFGKCVPNLKNSICSKGLLKFGSFVFQPCFSKLPNLPEPLVFSGFLEEAKFWKRALSLRERKYPPFGGGTSLPERRDFCVLIFLSSAATSSRRST